MPIAVQAQNAVINFQAGVINNVQVTVVASGASGLTGTQTFTWTLTAAEQAATQPFVTALVNKLASATGLGASTT